MEKKFTILLVDDHKENLVSLEGMLSMENREFLYALSGNEALKIMVRNEHIGLVMLDVQMPDMDGFEVASLLFHHSKTKHVPIIFVTAINKEERFVLKGFEEGAVDYLTKPLDIQLTRAKVRVFERLYRYQEELSHALSETKQINEHLGRFMYIVAHDLKSPLAGVGTMLSYVQSLPEIVSAPNISSYLEMGSKAISHLSDMIASILEYSRNPSYHQQNEQVDIQDLLQQLSQLLYPPPHIHIYIQAGFPSLVTNRLKLQQVFQNLISNAIKHNNKDKGLIDIGWTGPEAGFYQFSIKDNGPGIARKDQERIFKLFETINNNTENPDNTGIGLNLVKMFVEEQGGTVNVLSEPGLGSTFTFLWPQTPS